MSATMSAPTSSTLEGTLAQLRERYGELQSTYPNLPPFEISSITLFTLVLGTCFFSLKFASFGGKGFAGKSLGAPPAAGSTKKKKKGPGGPGVVVDHTAGGSKTAAPGNAAQAGPQQDAEQQQAAPPQSPARQQKTVLNAPVKQVIKARNQELHVLKQKKQLNNRERRLVKKLEQEVDKLHKARVDKHGMCLDPDEFVLGLGATAGGQEDDEAADDNRSGKSKSSAKPTSEENQPAQAKVIDLQRELGISMEQAVNSMIAQSLAQEEIRGGDDDTFQSVGGKKKGGKKQQLKEEAEGWEVVKPKRK